MSIRHRELLILLGGDIVFFLASLWLSLALRYFSLPDRELLDQHLPPFLLLCIAWVLVYYISGLYDKHTLFMQRRLAGHIARSQLINVVLAAIFFFVMPVFDIAPKTNLVVYLFVSSALLIVWRLYVVKVFWPHKRFKALLIAEGAEAEGLVREVNGNPRYNFTFVRHIDLDLIRSTPDFEDRAMRLIRTEQISVIVADPYDEHIQGLLPGLLDLVLTHGHLTFLNYYSVYEAIYDHLPLSTMQYSWFLAHMPKNAHIGYDVLKRILDLMGALVIGAFLVVLLPFIAFFIRLEGPGDILIRQRRIGRYGQRITLYKIRTMTQNFQTSGTWTNEDANMGNHITRVGSFLRKTSIDELPQVWNILKGEMSLIGPRSDIENLGVRLSEAIPYYNLRYLIKPGVTGWAQTHQHYAPGKISPQSIEESRVRLAFDLYYVKNRSFMLDISIALRTIQTLLTRFGTLL